MRENKIKTKLKNDEMVMALMFQFVHPGLAEYLGRLGFDCLIVDGEHGQVNESDCENFVRACDVSGAIPLMRIPYNPMLIQRYLDMGFYGFHFPHVESVEQAHAIVDAVKYKPQGNRGTGLPRVIDYGLSLTTWDEYAAQANRETFIKISIEDMQGVEAIPEICKIPEVDVITFGTGDLANAMGIPGQRYHPKLVKLVDENMAIIRAAGKQSGIPTFDGDDLEDGYRRGARFMSLVLTQVIAKGAVSWKIGKGARNFTK